MNGPQAKACGSDGASPLISLTMHHENQFCLEVADISVKIRSADPTLQFETQGAMKNFLSAEDQPDAQASATWSDLSRMSLGE